MTVERPTLPTVNVMPGRRTYESMSSWVGMGRHWVGRQRTAECRNAVRLATEHMQLPAHLPTRRKRRGSVWAISIVKNEADIVRQSVLHQLNQGVDGVLIADNQSSDDTREILYDLALEHPVFVALDTWSAFDQAVKTTLLANAARRAGAEWIVPFDADEFWFAPGALVADHLRAEPAQVVRAQIHNFFPFTDGPVTVERDYRFDLTPHALGKVAFRSHPLAFVGSGNHGVHRGGQTVEGLRIAHMPWRSLGQMKRKVVQGSAAVAEANLWSGWCWSWRTLAELPDDEIEARWRRLLAGEPAKDTSWSPIGPFARLSPLAWREWDPHGAVSRSATAANGPNYEGRSTPDHSRRTS